MPIVGWTNPYTNRRHLVQDYVGMAKVMPREILDIIARKDVEDKVHIGTNLTVTSGIGCPRRLVIERFLPCYPNPQRLWAPMMGTKWHEVLAQEMKGKPGWVVEVNGGVKECEVSGWLFGFAMTGRMDARFEDDGVVLEIKDYKFSLSGADKFVDENWVAKPEHIVQLNALRLLLKQMGKVVSDNVGMVAWVVGGSWIPTRVPIKSEEEIGSIKVFGSKYTVHELFKYVGNSFARIDKGESPTSIAEGLPLFGKDMMKSRKGTSMCDSCAVKGDCMELGGWEEAAVIPFIKKERVVEL